MKKRFTVTLDEDIVKLAKKKAIDENTSFSALVERLLSGHANQGGGDSPSSECAAQEDAKTDPA